MFVLNERPKDVESSNSIFWTTIGRILSRVIPQANPDYDQFIDKVNCWLIEFDEEGIPNREIGLDVEGQPILKMPYKNNYGYWIDNDLMVKDFKNLFQTENISAELFESKWNIKI